MQIKVNDTLDVKDLPVQTTVGRFSYTGKIFVTELSPKGSPSKLKINIRGKQDLPPSQDDYFTFNVLQEGHGYNGTASRTQIEAAIVKP